MKYASNFIMVSIIAFCVSCASLELVATGPDITGTWIMDVQTEAGSGNPTFVLTQEGESITGTYNGAFGEAPVTGTIADGNIELVITTSGMGQEIEVKYIGTLEEDGGMKGTLNMGEMGEGTFTGKKQQPSE